MRDLTQQALDTIKIIILASAVVLSVQYVFADWSGPTDNPPDGNPEPPVNVSIDDQEKTGPLYVGGLISRYGILIEDGELCLGGECKDAWPASLDPLWDGPDTSGNISYTAGDVSVGGGSITAGQGAFTGGVLVGDSTDSVETFLKVDAKNIVGKPSAEQCDETADLGNMFLRPKNDSTYLFICGIGTGQQNGCSAGSFCWRWV